MSNGAVSVSPPAEVSDENGTVIMASVRTYGDTNHTFIQNVNYKGIFLPGYKAHHNKEIFNETLPAIKFNKIDHIVGNQPDL